MRKNNPQIFLYLSKSAKKSTKELYFWYITGLRSKFLIQHVAAYIMLLYCIMFSFHLLSFTSLATRQVLIQFNYNPHSIISTIFQTESFYITIFQTESFNLLNWKVSQLKCISLIKLTSSLNTLFLQRWNLFPWEKSLEWMTKAVHKKCTKRNKRYTKKCAKVSFVVLIFMSVIILFFCFISLLFDYQ